MFQAAVDLVETEVLGDALGGPGAGIGFERAQHQLARVVLVVGAGVVVAHDRKAGVQALHRFEQSVVVLAGMQRHVHPDARRQFTGPHAGAQHHAVRVDIAAVGAYAGDASGRGADGRDRYVLKDARTGGAGALGQRIGDVHRVGVAVGRNVDAPEHVFGVKQRDLGLDRGRRDHLHLQPEDFRHRRAAPQLLEPFLVGCERIGTATPVAGRLAGFRLQAQIKLAGIARQFRHVDGSAQLAHQSGGVPGSARGELPAFQQHYVGHPVPRQVIGHRTADHAAADHDHAGAARQVGGTFAPGGHGPSGSQRLLARLVMSRQARKRTLAGSYTGSSSTVARLR